MKIDARRLAGRMARGRGLLVTVAAAGVLAAGGATAAVAAAHDDDGPGASATPTGDRPGTRPGDRSGGGGAPAAAEVPVARAVDAALKAAPGRVAEIELDDEHGVTAWEIDVVTDGGDRRDIAVDAGTGEVLANRADDRDDRDGDRDEDPAALRRAKVTAPAAAGAALKAVSGRVTSAEFETWHGKAVWEVDVTGEDGTAYEITVDAATGEVLDREAEQD
ncbi:PepSY domain-containing protein [Spirillospora sp. NPDC127506]|uniref:PepSY domain-containing protein n=1 Tax=Actinomadura sp. TaxID=1989 RepID=UPI003352E8E4